MNDNGNINNNYYNQKIPANSNIFLSRQVNNNINYNKSTSKKKNITNNKNNSKKENLKIQKFIEPPPLEILTPNIKKYQFYINKPEKNKKELFFKDNKISTTKYNIFTFLPKALLYQFMRLANIYFLFIAIIQSIPIISPLGAMSAIAPLVVVLSVSLIREAIEDYNKGKLDKEQNNEPVEVFDNEKWQNTTSGELNMGQIVSVKKDGIFPADLVLIDSSLNEGICYIETGTLDGEKTLKIKGSPDFTKGKFGVFGKPDPKEEEDLSKVSSASNKSKNSHIDGLSEREKFANIEDESINNNNIENENNLIKKKINYFSIEGNCQCDFPNASLYQLNGKINFKAEANIEGAINNQFSMDEKDDYFRIATTIGKTYNMDDSTSNSLYILDDKLQEVGRLDGIAKGEKIYSVRYVGNRAYVVTFKEIDPLFVIDLSDVRNPKILGELKIPGYSTYLHPYDETHLIGFGYDTKPNYSDTGVVNDGLKMSMFDISDFNNPKEMFTVKIGKQGTQSPLANNHKALLFSKEKNLIAFPISIYENGKREYKAQIYDIDLNKGFTLKGEINHNVNDVTDTIKYYSNYKLNIERIIYSNDVFYTLSKGLIKASDMNSLKEITKINLDTKSNEKPVLYNTVDFVE